MKINGYVLKSPSGSIIENTPCLGCDFECKIQRAFYSTKQSEEDTMSIDGEGKLIAEFKEAGRHKVLYERVNPMLTNCHYSV